MNIFKTSVVALVASVGFSAFGINAAQAEPRHWFYNDYGYYDGRAYQDRAYDRRFYDNRAYYDDEYYEDEDVVYEQPRRRHKKSRHKKKRKWVEKRLRNLIDLADNKLKKKERKRARRAERRRLEKRANRRNRQRLYDARQDEQWQVDQGQALPRVYQPKRRVKKTKKRLKLAYVPLPRVKPYHLIAGSTPNTAKARVSVKKFTLSGVQKPGTFDDRPSLSAISKKQVETAVKPQIVADIKPIRIEIKKTRPDQQAAKRIRKKSRVAVNQLSCNKAKTIVSDFGFSDITARTCTGKIYDFNAKRDGAPYTVKVSSLSGELKGVQRVK